jgi:Zn-finger nucleic acid-binding protein
MSQVLCPVCGAVAGGGHKIGDSTVFDCPRCGGYRLAGTVIALIDKGTQQKPNPAKFRDLVRKKRGNSTEYPVITSADLGS